MFYLLMITPGTREFFLCIIKEKSLKFLSNSKHLLKICFFSKIKDLQSDGGGEYTEHTF